MVEKKHPFLPAGMKCEICNVAGWERNAEDRLLIAAMKPGTKQKIYNFFSDKKSIQQNDFTRLIHPSAVVSSTVTVSPGCIIEPASVVASFAVLGFCVYINRGATVGHHTVVEDFATINPGVHIAGHCKIGKGTQVGIGAVVFDNVTIGSNTIIGGGSVVTKDIPDNVIAWGNPCRVIKENLSPADND